MKPLTELVTETHT